MVLLIMVLLSGIIALWTGRVARTVFHEGRVMAKSTQVFDFIKVGWV